MKKAAYFENNAVSAIISFGKRVISILATHKKYRWTKIYHIERKDETNKERFANEKEVWESFLHFCEGVQNYDFKMEEGWNWS